MTLPSGKGPDAFRTISEASAELGVPQHVLRFWETKFAFIRPMKRAGGRRFYRPQDLDVLRGVKALLHHEGYTIKGVQRLHREQGLKRLVAAGLGGPGAEAPAAERDAPTGAEGTPRAHQRSTAGDDAEEEEDGPQTGDLFETAAPSIRFPPAPATSSAPTPPARVEPTEIDPADLLAAAALPVEPPGERPSRHVLDPRARTRLAEVLDDLERTKDAIDALIGA